ncbi:TetR/AcrR family transcriptional regulator [Nocardia sp. NBC_00565]|uniref:TetR/AcrR family transcriptional regulator n=1 Tax=Nocardia sp. NBC_00565 TaxID=2975993 RepID=UPI002E80DEC0|nr:helix-turn-helix domain-containing protein [Nocardia sp. NBC_00565]WUC06538.1 TetR/AcrR family transcriptional regulator [Nocardia sp. NBC_00565]
MPSFGDQVTGRGPRRGLRADAQRNYDQLVSAAREVFAEHGVDAPLDEIARRAGIGNATMYRHFPTRRELIIAAYADEVAALCADGTALSAAESADEALFEWLRSFVAHVATKRELALAIPPDRDDQRSTLFDRWHEAMRATASTLLTRAQRAGTVRADVAVSDLLTLVNGIAVASTDPEQIERCLTLLRRGIEA